jgi:hypothetical protein
MLAIISTNDENAYLSCLKCCEAILEEYNALGRAIEIEPDKLIELINAHQCNNL